MGRKTIWSLPAAADGKSVRISAEFEAVSCHVTLCQRCRRLASVWSDAVCHVYLICTDSKRMFGWEKLHISGLQTLAKFLVSFPYLCKCWKMLKESRRGQKVLVYVLSGTWRLFFFWVSSADSSSQDMLDLNTTWRH